ncbi:hypothetical protein DH2020_044126 [Rehmannia glutinosa]|uniref:Increased DNA methylation 1 C-terminal domain-containing protein n=1 Tax=Rehmannia glutinosa TaxID=99300 RepID=A0ABR0UI86_REHGL
MFDCGPKTYITGQRDKFVRLDDMNSRLSSPSSSVPTNKCGFGIDGLGRGNHSTHAQSKSFKRRMRKGSQGLKSIGWSLGFGVSRAVFPEDLKVSEKKIFDPQDKLLTIWNKLFVMSCILGVSVDPLFFFLPVLNKSSICLDIDRKLAITATTLRTIVDAFYLIHMALQFRNAYIAPSSRVFGRAELCYLNTRHPECFDLLLPNQVEISSLLWCMGKFPLLLVYVVSAALLRIFGREVAELPLVATCKEKQEKQKYTRLTANSKREV